jgi:hypothetical protein
MDTPAVHLDQLPKEAVDGPRPACLMAGAEAGTIVTVEILKYS